MSKMFLKAGLGLLVLAGWTGSLSAAVAVKTLHGHVPAAVSQLSKTGELADTNQLHLALGLQLRNQAALDDLLSQVTDPANTNYGHYLSREEFTAQFAPTEADYQAVIAFAKTQGLKVTTTSSNRMLVEVEGSAATVKAAFKVSLHTYQHPTENRSFFAPDAEPSVPATLPILDISGLNSYDRPHTHLHVRPDAALTAASKTTKLGSGMGGTYMGNDLRTAYVPGSSLTGIGQNVALVEFDGYLASDIALYESVAGITNSMMLTNILLNGFSGYPTGSGGEVEVSLDIEMLVALSPGLNEALVYEGDPYNFIPNAVLNQIAVDNSARQITCSWGWSGGPDATSDQIFKEMILQGQTFYNASGDSDAFLPGEVDNPGYPGFPSSDPYITQVGATTLSTTGANGPYASETVWNWGIEYGLDGVGSSGGISSYYAIPWWQTNTSMAFNGGSTTFRNIPDVACVGDNILVIADGGVYYPGVGGTSCAAPLWAAFTALVNQQAVNVGHAVIGFINPALYALSLGQYYTNVFHDVTTGNNTWSASPTLFYAQTNYDLCTGLGSPNGTNLINALTSVTNVTLSVAGLIPSPTQPWGNTLSAMNGADPNGLWLLYYRDQDSSYAGTNYNGWAVNLITANPVDQAADNELTGRTLVNSVNFGNVTNVSVVPGSTWQVTVAVTNWGPSLSSNVFVSDTLPATGVTLVSSNVTMGNLTSFGSTLIWSVSTNSTSTNYLGTTMTNVLGVGAGGILTLNFKVNTGGIFTNYASVSGATTDPNPDDDSVTVIATSLFTPPILVPHLAANGAHGFQLSVSNNAGSSVVIQASTNLTSWLPVYTNLSPFTFTNLDSTNYSRRFYRAVVGQ